MTPSQHARLQPRKLGSAGRRRAHERDAGTAGPGPWATRNTAITSRVAGRFTVGWDARAAVGTARTAVLPQCGPRGQFRQGGARVEPVAAHDHPPNPKTGRRPGNPALHPARPWSDPDVRRGMPVRPARYHHASPERAARGRTLARTGRRHAVAGIASRVRAPSRAASARGLPHPVAWPDPDGAGGGQRVAGRMGYRGTRRCRGAAGSPRAGRPGDRARADRTAGAGRWCTVADGAREHAGSSL